MWVLYIVFHSKLNFHVSYDSDLLNRMNEGDNESLQKGREEGMKWRRNRSRREKRRSMTHKQTDMTQLLKRVESERMKMHQTSRHGRHGKSYKSIYSCRDACLASKKRRQKGDLIPLFLGMRYPSSSYLFLSFCSYFLVFIREENSVVYGNREHPANVFFRINENTYWREREAGKTKPRRMNKQKRNEPEIHFSSERQRRWVSQSMMMIIMIILGMMSLSFTSWLSYQIRGFPLTSELKENLRCKERSEKGVDSSFTFSQVHKK
jgi:hypothetical protein